MSTLKLVIGNCNYSSWSLRPWLFLRHHGIEFEQHRVVLSAPTTEEALSDFFSGDKVPVLLDGDLQVWDSLAILEYLAESFPEKQGWPVDRNARAMARSVAAEMHSSFPSLRSELPMNCRRRFPGFKLSAETQLDIDRITTVWRYCREQFGQHGPWLFGGFSVADCMYAPVVIRLIGYDVALDPVSKVYAETVYQSDAIQKWIALGKAEPEVIEADEADGNSLPV